MTHLERLVNRYRVGDWLATVDGKVVGKGDTMVEAIEVAEAAGYSGEDYVLEIVAPKNLLFLGTYQ